MNVEKLAKYNKLWTALAGGVAYSIATFFGMPVTEVLPYVTAVFVWLIPNAGS
jgi:hypothetical protein